MLRAGGVAQPAGPRDCARGGPVARAQSRAGDGRSSPAVTVVMSQWRILAHHHVCWPAAVRHQRDLSRPGAMKIMRAVSAGGDLHGGWVRNVMPGTRPGAVRVPGGWGRCRVCGPRHLPHGAGMTGECGSHGQPRLGGTASACGQAQPSHGVRGWPACAAHAGPPHVWERAEFGPLGHISPEHVQIQRAHRGQRPQVVARPQVVPRIATMVILMFPLQMYRGRADRGRGDACVLLTRRGAGSAPGGHRRLANSRRPRPRRTGRGRETRCRAGRRGGSRQRRRRGQ
jgi:hypothetical protein